MNFCTKPNQAISPENPLTINQMTMMMKINFHAKMKILLASLYYYKCLLLLLLLFALCYCTGVSVNYESMICMIQNLTQWFFFKLLIFFNFWIYRHTPNTHQTHTHTNVLTDTDSCKHIRQHIIIIIILYLSKP